MIYILVERMHKITLDVSMLHGFIKVKRKINFVVSIEAGGIMNEVKVIIVNSWWQAPLFIAFLSSFLTGLFFALILYFHSRIMEKRDVLVSLNSELAGNYNVIKEIQDVSNVNGLNIKPNMIASLRKVMPWNSDLDDEQTYLDFHKNQPVNHELSIECWAKLQSQVARYSKKYYKYEEIYRVLKRIIRFSKMKSGETSEINLAQKAAINQLGAIRMNSEEFLLKYEEMEFFK